MTVWRRLVQIMFVVTLLGSGLTVGPVVSVYGSSVTCGMTVTSSVTLTSDLTCAGNGLVVGADNITINLNGHRLSGNGTGAGIGAISHAGLSVLNGAIDRFEGGVRLFNAHDVFALRMALLGNRTGLEAVSTNRVTVRDTAVVGNRGGVATSQTFRMLYQRVVVADNQGTGINIFQGGSDQITDSFIGRQPTGIVIDDLATGPETILRNVFLNNGIGLQFGTASHGFVVARNSSVTSNQFVNNGAAGLLVMARIGSLAGTVVSNNRFVHNGYHPNGVTDLGGTVVDDGANIFVAPGVGGLTVSGNGADTNSDYGIEAVGVVDGGGNHAKGNGNPAQCLGVKC
jgi:nitrous oxidase accessory protein NosD